MDEREWAKITQRIAEEGWTATKWIVEGDIVERGAESVGCEDDPRPTLHPLDCFCVDCLR